MQNVRGVNCYPYKRLGERGREVLAMPGRGGGGGG